MMLDWIRSALRLARRRHVKSKLERRHARGYARHPVTPGEFDVWEDEQECGDGVDAKVLEPAPKHLQIL
jgi:hypothetical protein